MTYNMSVIAVSNQGKVKYYTSYNTCFLVCRQWWLPSGLMVSIIANVGLMTTNMWVIIVTICFTSLLCSLLAKSAQLISLSLWHQVFARLTRTFISVLSTFWCLGTKRLSPKAQYFTLDFSCFMNLLINLELAYFLLVFGVFSVQTVYTSPQTPA